MAKIFERRKMITKITTLGLIVLFCAGLLSSNYAQPAKVEGHSCPDCPSKEGMKEKPEMMKGPGMMMVEPEMSMEMEKVMHEFRMKLHKEIAPLRTEIEIKAMELEALWMEDKLDVEKIVKKSQEIHKIQGQIQEKEIRHQFEIYKSLKPEQQKMFRNRHRMGMGPKGPFGPRMCHMSSMGGCCE